MIRTYGLTHIALPVKDVRRTALFYERVFGARVMYSHEGFIQVQTPGSHDILVFEEGAATPVPAGFHFGFRLVEQEDPEKMAAMITAAGGAIRDKGSFGPGEPYVFFYDPDGYEVEVFYENIPDELKDFN